MVEKSRDPVKPRVKKSRDPIELRAQKSRDPIELRAQKSHDPVGGVKKFRPTPLPDNLWPTPYARREQGSNIMAIRMVIVTRSYIAACIRRSPQFIHAELVGRQG